MKIYLDVIFFINFAFDFILLLTVKLILKKRVKLYRIFLGSFLASFSIFFLFIKINSFMLFLFKIIISILMILITFGKKQFLKNILYLYFASILLGGFLYFVNLQLSYKNEGLIFFYNGFSINIIILIIISPIILYMYYKQSRYFEDTLTNVHSIDIYFDNDTKNFRAYLDTGNKLYDPYKNREVILLYDEELYYKLDNFIMIPFETLSSTGFLKGIQVKKIIIDGKFIYENIILGISKKPFHLEEAQVILHSNFKNRLL